jgi:hypothetical protein
MGTIYENKQKAEEIKTEPHKPVVLNEDKIEEDGKLSLTMLTFLNRFEKSIKEEEVVDSPIKVSEVLGKLAFLYEKIRTTVEYKGEHVLRRNAIERIIRRLAWEQDGIRTNVNTERIASTLLRELIWARYLPNNSVPKSKVREVEKIVAKYLYFLRNLDNIPEETSVSRVRAWIWGVASSEIEDVIDPSNREIYVKLMYDWFNSYFIWDDKEIPEHEKEIQIYLSIHRSFPKSDDPIMRFHLLLREFPKWREADYHTINELILKFPYIYREIEKHLNSPVKLVLFRKIQKHSGAFEVFQTLAKEEKGSLRKLMEDEKKFSERIVEVCEVKYRTIKQKVNTGIVRSIIYIFLTKVLLALLLEVPYEVYRHEDIRYLPLSINIIFPPMLMWFIGLSITIPGAKNTQAIIGKVKSFVYPNGNLKKQLFSIHQVSGRSTLVQIFSFIYLVSFIFVFSLVTYLLVALNFTVLGMIIFFMFLSLVLLFAYRVRYNANQLKVESEQESAVGHFMNYLTLPFLNFGFFLSKGMAKLNFLTILLDFMIEAPLKSVIEIFEEWTAFMREKKEEVVEVPE